MSRRTFALLVALFLALAAAAPAPARIRPAQEPAKTLPQGAKIAGTDVSGLGPVRAERAVRAAVGPRNDKPITVSIKGRHRRVLPAAAGLTIHYARMVQRAFDLAAHGRRVDVGLDRDIDPDKLGAEVSRLGRRWYRPPRDARAELGIERVKRRPGRMGRRLYAEGLRRKLVGEMLRPTGARLVVGGLRPVKPKVTFRRLASLHSTYVSVDRGAKKARLFKRLKLVKTYPIAVGAAGFDTPSGNHKIISKTVNPAWSAPNRPWAGALAGQTIPPGDPRNPLLARFLAIGGGVGFHGTANSGSIGTAASHGCIRMLVPDVIDLYKRVPVGTPVKIR